MTEPLLCEKNNCSTELDNLENNYSFQIMIKRYLIKNVKVLIMFLLAKLQNQTEAKGISGKWANSF